jgi:Tfp pilus assembly protein PilF
MNKFNDIQSLHAQGRYADVLLALDDLTSNNSEDTLDDEKCRALGVLSALALALPDLAARQHINQAKAWQVQGLEEQARSAFKMAIKRWPDSVMVHLQLAVFHESNNELDLSEKYLQGALKLEPHNSVVWNSLGNILKKQNNSHGSLLAYRQALRFNPEMAEAHNNIANGYKDAQQPYEAEWHYRRAIKIRPSFYEACNNFGVFLHEQGRIDESILLYQKAITIDPRQVSARNNLAGSLLNQLRFDEAELLYQQALELNADYADARFNWAVSRLTQGDLSPETWAAYETRYNPLRRVRMTFPPAYPFPMWNGQSLTGKRILIWKEQGLGDQIMFVRFLAKFRALGVKSVVLVCHRALISIFEGVDGIDVLATENDAIPWCDYWTYTMSLPGLFGTNLNNIPNNVPYLQPKIQWQHAARKRINACTVKGGAILRVGICWRGSTNYARDHLRSPGLAPFAALFAIPRVDYFTLLPDSREEFLVAASTSGVDWGKELDSDSPPFEETAALLCELDLVITSDTSIAHLAGALGRPTWVVLPYLPYWTWMIKRDDSPWYPNMRLFRQEAVGEWSDVFEHVALALTEHLNLESYNA